MEYEPLTHKEQSLLLDRQLDSKLHPYTCFKHHTLYPTSKYWRCEKCDYTQKYGIFEMVRIGRNVKGEKI